MSKRSESPEVVGRDLFYAWMKGLGYNRAELTDKHLAELWDKFELSELRQGAA